MSNRITLTLIALMIALPISRLEAQPRWESGNTKGMDEYKRPAAKASVVYMAVGTVVSVDRQVGAATVSHGPIKGLDAPPMTMSFDVPDKTLLNLLEAGRVVKFQFIQQGMSFVIVSVVPSASRSGTPAA